MVSERLAPDGQYTLEKAHAGYKTLLSELDELSGAVARAAEGKVTTMPRELHHLRHQIYMHAILKTQAHEHT